MDNKDQEIEAAFEAIKLRPYKDDWNGFKEFCNPKSEYISSEISLFHIWNTVNYLGENEALYQIYQFSADSLEPSVYECCKFNIELYNAVLKHKIEVEYRYYIQERLEIYTKKGLGFADYCRINSDSIMKGAFWYFKAGGEFSVTDDTLSTVDSRFFDYKRDETKKDFGYAKLKIPDRIPFLLVINQLEKFFPENKKGNNSIKEALKYHRLALAYFQLASVYQTWVLLFRFGERLLPEDERQTCNLKMQIWNKDKKIALLEARNLMDKMDHALSKFYATSKLAKETTTTPQEIKNNNYQRVVKAINRYLSARTKATTINGLEEQLKGANTFLMESTNLSENTVIKHKKRWITEQQLN
ncbi:hypothetical protein N7931_01475 [Catenovulum sp. 2E275]|uniref:hypothetical protein n=1 Tax=Catenovulum sp. 2E275 TaxID=2980497 RepID=UPI0021D3A287|nr:hypothetical protein [Catenovulum sp. 2E275]MCU4674289.1 hypothetical protein [Catenovulum sp. 2E275]